MARASLKPSQSPAALTMTQKTFMGTPNTGVAIAGSTTAAAPPTHIAK